MNRTTQVTEAQVRANRLDLLSQLADDLAHEIKNPLHSVAINAELLRRRLEEGDVAAGLARLGVIVAESARLHDVVDGLLRLFRPGREAQEVLDLDQALTELVSLVQVPARLTRVELVYEPSRGGVMVNIAPAALDQVVLNLTLAALREIGTEGGRLELTTSATAEVASVLVKLAGGAPSAPSPPPAREASDPPGSDGRGVAVAAELARRAGGRLEREGEGGSAPGTVFRLVLPRFSGA